MILSMRSTVVLPNSVPALKLRMSNFRLCLSVNAEGLTREDLAIALREVIRKLDDGYITGSDESEDGCYEFSLTEQLNRPLLEVSSNA